MPSQTEKHRDHPKIPDAFGIERADALVERRLHQLKKGEHHALAGQALGKL